jgi:hypothetical protein
MLVSGVACAVLLGVPAVAGACPTVSRVKSFNGTTSLAFNETLTGSDGHGGQTTMTLSHNATGLSVSRIALVYPLEGPPYWEGTTSGGTMTVHDVYGDLDGGGDTHGQQDASGPSRPVLAAGVDFDSANCTYDVSASDSISTVTSGSGPHDPDVDDVALSPFMPTPADFKLAGSVTIPAYADPVTSVVLTPSGGFYQFSESNWGIAFAALTGNVDGPVGPATFSWNLTPTFYPPAKPMCQVPRVSGLTLSAARRRLRNARCSVGQIKLRHSSSTAKGRVISSRPSFGARRRVNTKITLTVSSGRRRKG